MLYLWPLLAVLSTASASDRLAMVDLIANLALLKPHAEFIMLVDPAVPGLDGVVNALAKRGTPLSVHSIVDLAIRQSNLPPKPCPSLAIVKSIIAPKSRKAEWLLPVTKHHRTIFVWSYNASQLRLSLSIADHSSLYCPMLIDPGLLDENTRFFFYVGDNDDLVRTVFAERDTTTGKCPRINAHPYAAVIKKIGTGSELKFAFYNNNFFVADPISSALCTSLNVSFVWKRATPIPEAGQVFTSQADFHNLTLKVSAMPWSIWVSQLDPDNPLSDFWGVETMMMSTIGSVLNFGHSVSIPPDQTWGALTPNGTWSGNMRRLYNEDVHIAFGCLNLEYKIEPMASFSVAYYRDFISFVAPNPKLRSRALAIVNPFDVPIWVGLALSVPFISFVFYVIAIVEGHLMGREFAPWNRWRDAFSQTYCHLLNQFQNDEARETGTALRCAMLFWLFYCFVITVTYVGMLKGFLTSPSYYPAITSLADIVHSGLPCHMNSYTRAGGQVSLQQTGDQYLKTIMENNVDDEADPLDYLPLVYAGKEINFDWYSGLQFAVAVAYTTPDGNPLIKVAQSAIFYGESPVAWRFGKFIPWRDSVNTVMRNVIESGLFDQWMANAFKKMKDDRLASGEKSAQAVFEPDVSAMSLEDFQSPFVLYGLVFLLAFVALASEGVVAGCGKREKNNNSIRSGEKRIKE